MKTIRNIIGATIAYFLIFGSIALALPNTSYQQNTLPFQTNTYDFGTSTLQWKNGWFASSSISNLNIGSWTATTTATSTTQGGIRALRFCFLDGICKSDSVEITGSGGTNQLTYWTGATSLGATSSPTFTSFVATSTTATSTIAGNLAVTGNVQAGRIIAPIITDTTGNVSITGNLTVTGTNTLQNVGANMIVTTNGSNVLVASSTPTAAYYLATSSTASQFQGGFLALASSTLQNFTGVLATTTAATTTNLAVSSLTATRIPFTTTGGAFVDDSDLTFTAGNLLTATYASSTSLTTTGYAAFATSGGNVGIGTTTPGALLTVRAASGFTSEIEAIGNLSTVNAEVASLVLGTDESGLNKKQASISYLREAFSNDGNASLLFKTRSSSALTEWLRITSGGNVGIGTTSPWGLLAVNPNGVSGPEFAVGSSTKTDFVITNAGNVGIGTAAPSGQLYVKSSGTSVPSNIYLEGGQTWRIVSDAATSPEFLANSLAFRNPSAGVTAMVISNAGNVGIGTGTTNPGTRLHVVDSNGNDGTIAAGVSSRATFGWNNNGQGTVEIKNNFTGGNPNAITFWAAPNSGSVAEMMRIQGNGNVGIGTTSPTRTLEVNGTVAANLTTFASGDSAVCQRNANGLFTFNSGVTTCAVSTRTVKHHILTVSVRDSLARVMALNPVSFEYNGTNKPDIGLIAEEVAHIDPRYAQYNDKGEARAINWAAVTADLVRVIQEQQKKIERLEERVKRLEERR